ncbi:hypothetical protein IV102_13920 [bacterium]|nr:hypothetical protein [bacterium]
MKNSLSMRYRQLVLTLHSMLEARNPYNLDHCRQVARYCDKVARHLQLGPTRQRVLTWAAEVHSLGELLQVEEKNPQQSLPVTQLGLKNGRETSIHEREREILEAILGNVPGCRQSALVVRQRHECYDGSGSPHGLRGQEILLEARILAAVDAFVDLSTPKAHRPAEPPREILSRLHQQSGRQFDPRVIEALLTILRGEEGPCGDYARSQQFEDARGHHHLKLGHFYGKIHEADWALRSYAIAKRIAVSSNNQDLEVKAIAGQFLVHVNQGDLEQARQSLHRYRSCHLSGRGQTFAHLYWGLLRWLEELGPGRIGAGETGQQIVEAVIARCREQQWVDVLTCALAFQSTMLLCQKGPTDPQHVNSLGQFLEIVSHRDVFDVVERYRLQTVPILLNGVAQNIHAALCRNLLNRLGEPCPDAVCERLRLFPPVGWKGVLLGASDCETPSANSFAEPLAGEPVLVRLTGPLRIEWANHNFGFEEFSTLKAARLFALLVFHRGGILDEALLEVFWPDAEPERARNSLRNSLHKVRQTLKKFLGEVRTVDRCRKTGIIRLNCTYQTDCDLFLTELLQAQELTRQQQWGPALLRVRQAVLHLSGELMQGADDEYIVGPRAQLANQHLRALLLQGRLEYELHQGDACEATAGQVLGLDDLNEDAHRLRLQALALQQRHADLATCFALSQHHFKSELGIVPRSIVAAFEACQKTQALDGTDPQDGPVGVSIERRKDSSS